MNSDMQEVKFAWHYEGLVCGKKKEVIVGMLTLLPFKGHYLSSQRNSVMAFLGNDKL